LADASWYHWTLSDQKTILASQQYDRQIVRESIRRNGLTNSE